jgi:hypothetical protein
MEHYRAGEVLPSTWRRAGSCAVPETNKGNANMHSIIYIIGLVVVVLAIISFIA